MGTKTKRKQYKQNFHKTHPTYNSDYYNNHKEYILTSHKEYKNRPEVKQHNKEHAKEYYQTHKKQFQDYQRTHYLTSSKLSSNGKSINVNKRPYTNYCEICGKPKLKNLNYHHWNNTTPELGIWVCCKCHNLAEALDNLEFQVLANQYQIIKTTLENNKTRR